MTHNRRLHDLEQKSYIRQEALRGIVERGEDLEVLQERDGMDITVPMLIEIWRECESENQQFTTQQLIELMHLLHAARPGLQKSSRSST